MGWCTWCVFFSRLAAPARFRCRLCSVGIPRVVDGNVLASPPSARLHLLRTLPFSLIGSGTFPVICTASPCRFSPTRCSVAMHRVGVHSLPNTPTRSYFLQRRPRTPAAQSLDVLCTNTPPQSLPKWCLCSPLCVCLPLCRCCAGTVEMEVRRDALHLSCAVYSAA